MESHTHVHLGKDRRLAIPSHFCKEANLRPGDSFLISKQGTQLVLTPLEVEAEKMREELRAMLEPGTDMMKDLREMRVADTEDEARHR
jgi:bifunctional DNA-binding transcriptional regulator/antitoxin component of YhaV-PrlF toxin-antitoxin module